MQNEMPLKTTVDVLNYALTVEHLLHAYYRQGLQQFNAGAFAAAGYAANVFDWFAMIRDQEQDHIDLLTKLVGEQGGQPVPEGAYDFAFRDLAGFFSLAQELENTVVSAYQGVLGHLIDDADVITAVLTIHGVDARHAAYVSGLQGDAPFPAAFNPTTTPEETLAVLGPFTAAG